MGALPGQADHLPGPDALGHAHVQLLAVDGDAQAAVVGRLQRYRQLGAGITGCGAGPGAAEARAGARALAAALAREQALEEVARSRR